LLLLLLAAPLALAQLPKPEPADMRIEGVVADALSGAPVAGARVEFMGSHVDGDAAGRFRFDGLGPGTYNLRVRRAGYLQADQQVVLNAGQTSATLRIALTPGAAIEGTVSDALSGAPIAGARLALNSIGIRFLALSDHAGHFRFDGLAAGTQYLMVVRTGYMRTYQKIELARAQNFNGVRIALTPQAAIAGKVEDQDGFPVFGARIAALTRDTSGELIFRGGGEANDLGNFRVSDLPSGCYYLHVEPVFARDWDARYTDVYYPAAVKFEEAQAIEVSPGQERSGIPIRLPRSPGVRVQGRVVLPPGFSAEKSGRRAVVWLTTVGVRGFGLNNTLPLAGDGSFSFSGVPPGKYRLQPQLLLPYNRGIAMAMEPNLEVGTADIAGKVLPADATPLLDLHIDVVFESGWEQDYVAVSLRNRAMRIESVDAPSGFDITGLLPGKYRIEANSLEGRTFPVSARLGDTNLPDGNLELKGPNPGPLKITMTAAVAQVEGTIVNAAGQPVSGKYALFRAVKPGWPPVVMGIAKPKGQFTAVLLPGAYRVWTAGAVPANLWDGAADAPPGQGRIVTFVKGNNPPLRLAMPAAK
jgi:hypothetical protein